MKSTILLCLTALVLLSLCAAQDLPFQSHSFNDLDYITQQLVKGIDAFKIDVNSIDRDSCQTYSTWKTSDNICVVDNYDTEICCLGLRGDTSSSPKLNDYFNTTNDFLGVLNNTKYDFIWQKDNRIARYNRTIYIALNIQYSFIQNAVTKSWLSQMIQIIQQRNLDIQLILGSNGVVDYFVPICNNHSQECDAQSAVIAAYPFILQSGSSDPNPDPNGNTANFNMMFPSLPSFCASGFPSYGDELPYFFYEVAHQTDVQFIANTYMSSDCQRSASHSDLSTIRITSNIDPEMLQSYLPQTNPFAGITTATNVLIETLEADQQIFLAYYDTSSNTTHIQIRTLNSSLQVVSEVQISNGPFTKISYKAPYLLLHSQAFAHIYEINTTSSNFLQSMYNITSPGLTSDIGYYNNELYFVQVETGGKCSGTSLLLVLTTLDTERQVFSQCTEAIKAFNVNAIQNADLSVVVQASGIMTGSLFVSAAYQNLGEQKDAIYAFTLTTNLNSAQSFAVVVPTSYIDFGVDPSVKLINNNDTLFVLEAHSNGICQCADFINNGNTYKCGVSDTTNPHTAYLQNVEYLMNYNWGKLSDFQSRTQSGQFVNGCDSNIMHAKFYNGEYPSGTVFRNATTGSLQAIFANDLVDYSTIPLVTKLFCGSTTPGENSGASATVNVFNLVDYYLFDYLN